MLEVGTHVGASTAHNAYALKELRSGGSDGMHELTTVDIKDMNDPVSRPWVKLGSTYSPKEVLQRLEADDGIEFRTSGSIEFLRDDESRYDLIFLDGNHTATHVYQEVPLALSRLNRGGYVVLHDYFPNLAPLWPGEGVTHGVFLAIKRLREEGADLEVAPLGDLPWATKRGTNTTSLALLGRS
jgi:predicted O-methyltransferase YrrM